MVKMVMVIGRRADFTHEAFVKYVSTKHLEAVDRVPEFRNRVRRYMQNHLLIHPSDVGAFAQLPIQVNADEIVEVWFDTVESIKQAFQEPRYLEIIRPDEHAFGDVEGAWGVVTDEVPVSERPSFTGHIKLFVFLKRKPGLTHAQFLSGWSEVRDQHLIEAAAFRRHVGRMVQNHVRQDPADSLPGMDKYDVVVELWFDSLISAADFASDTEVSAVSFKADIIDSASTMTYVAEDNPAAAEWLRRGQSTPLGQPRP